MTFDDPAVADELVFSFSTFKHPAEDGGLVVDDTMPFTFVRLLTPDLAFGVDTSGIIRNRAGFPQEAGFGTTSLTLKGLIYKNEPRETLLSAGLTWGIGNTGDHAVGGGRPDILQPGIFFGKGFGDLPDNLAFFRPFGIAGALTAELPNGHTTTIVGVDNSTGRFGPLTTQLPNTLHWGFALEYSTLYLTNRFTGGPPKQSDATSTTPKPNWHFTTADARIKLKSLYPAL